MSGFDINWLDLRASADTRARNADILRAAAAWLGARDAPTVLDLGCGAGATYQALAPTLAQSARWILVDNDTRLLDEAARRIGPDAETRRMDLSDFARLDIPAGTLIACSALLDLVSGAWLRRLAGLAAERGCALYAALDVGGPPVLDPPHPDDGAVFAGFAAHQKTDKGFGPALGPDAPGETERAFEAAGYRVRSGASDWRLEGPPDEGLLRALIDGWSQAAREAEPGLGTRLDAWRRERRRDVEAGALRAVVPHRDTFAEPVP